MAGGLILTGRPGTGKTTVFLEVIKLLKDLEISIGGFVSKEVRCRGERIGFEVEDLTSHEKGWLARVGEQAGPRIGKYVVCLDDFERVGVSALASALNGRDIDLIAIDEIGPMEMRSLLFRSLMKDIFRGRKSFFVTLHSRLVTSLIIPHGTDKVEVTMSNRTRLSARLTPMIYEMVRGLSPSRATN